MSNPTKPVELFKHLSASPHRTCQWPFGHPGDEAFYFCGKGTYEGFSYCKNHVALAYRVPEKRGAEQPKRNAA